MAVPRVPETLLDPLVAFFKPQRVVLFGSHARGEATADSDLDLLVVLDDDTPAERLSARSVAQARAGYTGPVDIIPCRASALYERARAVGSFAHIVLRDGITVYERQ